MVGTNANTYHKILQVKCYTKKGVMRKLIMIIVQPLGWSECSSPTECVVPLSFCSIFWSSSIPVVLVPNFVSSGNFNLILPSWEFNWRKCWKMCLDQDGRGIASLWAACAPSGLFSWPSGLTPGQTPPSQWDMPFTSPAPHPPHSDQIESSSCAKASCLHGWREARALCGFKNLWLFCG